MRSVDKFPDMNLHYLSAQSSLASGLTAYRSEIGNRTFDILLKRCLFSDLAASNFQG